MKITQPEPSELPKGHEARFEAKLDKAFSENISEDKNTFMPWLKIAAVAIVFVAVSFFGYQQLSKTGLKFVNDPNKSVVENNTENLENSKKPQTHIGRSFTRS